MPFVVMTLRREPWYRADAFEEGFRRLGYEIRHPARPTGRDFFAGIEPQSRDDCLLTWNVKQGHDEQTADLFEARGGTVIVAENAYIQKVDKSAYAISTHRHNGRGWYPYDLSVDRWTPLGFQQLPWRTEGQHVLVTAQRGVGCKAMASPAGWHERLRVNTELALMERGTPVREVRVRPHPGNFVAKIPIEKDLANAWACVIWSSACGVRALVEGVPVFFDAPNWICEDVAMRPRSLKKTFEVPRFSYEDVRAALNKMSHGQWSVDEIRSGLPFALMRDAGWGPRPEVISATTTGGTTMYPRLA